MTADDARRLERTFELAERGRRTASPNPVVGCVIVRDGVVLGEAVTAPGGRPHAEEQALRTAGPAARGATAYVTLEPCGERSSGAASCSELLVAAGVARVVVAAADSSPLASGRGVLRLRNAGVATDLGLLSDEAAGLYVAYRA